MVPECSLVVYTNKKAVLSQRRPRGAPYISMPENFRQSLHDTATFPEIFNGLLFRLILWMCEQNLKFIALLVPEIIEDIQKHVGSPWIHPRCLFSKIFDGLLFGWMDHMNVSDKFEVRIFTHSWDNSDWSFGWGLRSCKPPVLGNRRP